MQRQRRSATSFQHLAISRRKADFSCFGNHPDLESRLTFQGKQLLVSVWSRYTAALPAEGNSSVGLRSKSGVHQLRRAYGRRRVYGPDSRWLCWEAGLVARSRRGDPVGVLSRVTPIVHKLNSSVGDSRFTERSQQL
jgi:hypothetical protein